MGTRVTARVKWWRGAWWVLAQGPGIRNASGRRAKRIGPTDEDRVKAEAMAERLRQADALARRGQLTPLPVSEVLLDWFEQHRATLKPSTRSTTLSAIKVHLVPYFGDRGLREIRRADLLAFASAKVAAGKSPKLISNTLGILRRVLNLAVQDGLLDRNVAARLGEITGRLERSQASEVRQVDAWTREEVVAILELAREKEPRAYPVLQLLFSTGLRRGEALGLQWRDIDWSRKKIHVRRARVRDRTGTPKSGKARQVDMAPQLERVLRAVQAERRRAHPWRDPNGWVFTSRDGRQPLGETVFNRAWRRLRGRFAEKKIRPLTLHSARHTWATLALQAGKSIRWTAEQLGHSDPAITIRVYAHALPDEGEDLGFLDFTGTNSSEYSMTTREADVPISSLH